jgi:hypothetical protein
MAALNGCMKHGGAGSVNGVRIGAVVKEEAYSPEMAVSDGNMERSRPYFGPCSTSAGRVVLPMLA